MHQVPARVWNEIAKKHGDLLVTKWAKKIFPMGPEEMDKELEIQEKMLMKRYTAAVTLAYQIFGVLLVERKAIRAYLEDHPEMMGALPIVETPLEALDLATRDYYLDKEQAATLMNMLKELYLPD